MRERDFHSFEKGFKYQLCHPDVVEKAVVFLLIQSMKYAARLQSKKKCNNLFNKWRYKKRQDAEARRGFKAWQARKDLKTKLNNRMLSKQDNIMWAAL